MGEARLMRPRARDEAIRRWSSRVSPVVARRATILASALFVLSGSWGTGGAAEVDPFSGIEEMIVLGDEDSKLADYDDVSVIEFDAEHLTAIGAKDISDIAAFTPNLEIRTPFAASSPTLFIRGVGIRDFAASSSSSVAVYNDEIYMNAPAGQLAQLFDTQNIEVLRGPQATMYGRNASAGSLRVVTRKPTGTPSSTLTATYGRFNQVDLNGAIENVLIEDRLSMRTAAKWSVRKGTTKNRCADIDYTQRIRLRDIDTETPEGLLNGLIYGVNLACFNPENVDTRISPPGVGWTRGQPGTIKEWVNDRNNWAARSILRFQHPFLDMDWQLNLHGGQNRGDARQFQMIAGTQRPLEQLPSPAPAFLDVDEYVDHDNRVYIGRSSLVPILDPFIGNPFEGDYDNVEQEKIDLFGASLVGKMSFGDYVLTLITGYEWNKRDTEINLDGNPYPSLQLAFQNKSYQLTQEIRLDFGDDGPYSWQLGGMFLYDAIDSENFFPFAITNPAIEQEYTFFTRHVSAWAQFDWDPSENFSLKAGARINYEDKELNLSRQTVTRVLGTTSTVPITFPSGDPRAGQPIPPRRAGSTVTSYGWAGKFVATWRPDEDFDFYLSYTRGWKGPHINSVVVNPGPDGTESGALSDPVDPETLDSIEVGIKSRFFHGRVALNSAFFYYDYQDLQTYALRNESGATPAPELINADDADIYGVEADGRPCENGSSF